MQRYTVYEWKNLFDFLNKDSGAGNIPAQFWHGSKIVNFSKNMKKKTSFVADQTII